MCHHLANAKMKFVGRWQERILFTITFVSRSRSYLVDVRGQYWVCTFNEIQYFPHYKKLGLNSFSNLGENETNLLRGVYYILFSEQCRSRIGFTYPQ